MIFTETKLNGSFVIELNPMTDDRGWFMRSFCKEEFKKIDFLGEWVQLNHSFTTKKGTIRGMHFQIPPFEEAKLVRCIAGEVFDVIIDIRKNSPTFLQWFGIKLSVTNKKMIYIPQGFAHGFQTITDNAELIYHHSEFYKSGYESGIRYNDERIGIEWEFAPSMISERDIKFDLLNNNFKGI